MEFISNYCYYDTLILFTTGSLAGLVSGPGSTQNILEINIYIF